MPSLKNIRHEKAVQAYLSNGGLKTAAYRSVFKNAAKWKPNTVNTRASEFFSRSKVLVRIQELQKEIDIENKYNLENILKGFGQIAFADITDIFDFDETTQKLMLIGGAKKLSELPRSITGCIQSLKSTKDGVEVKLYAKDNALAQIAKMKGHYAPIKTITAESTLADLLKPDDK
jgi:hypothetical protein